MELCSIKRRATTRIFKDFPHRSASYLWHLLKVVHGQLGKQAAVSLPLQQLCDKQNSELFERITRKRAAARHELTLADQDELLNAVRVMANVCNGVFSKYSFGYFESVQKERFSNRYSGRFRIAHGKPPHTSFTAYSGSQSFSDAEAMLLNLQDGEGLKLTPLILWYPCLQHRDIENGHCYLFDKLRGAGEDAIATFKAAGFPCQLQVTTRDSETTELLSQLALFRSQDPECETIRDLRMTETKLSAPTA